ncbi:transglycosylase domain-containing protein [Peptoniphilus catoniae]|uniref:transglycosylase domain-containing protein n=1 Tax=Peptoniphilus catoniae TaxID=1660341 RepID=UPI0010FE5DCD|nr:transglycosylase domain-containing protein [Peptoniphilus catoniae]
MTYNKKGFSRRLLSKAFLVLFIGFFLLLIYGIYSVASLGDIEIKDKDYYKNQVISSGYEYVEIKNMPKDLINSFIAIEDHRFYRHKGIDPLAILGSIRDNIKSKKLVRGGSTISQQFIKNAYLSPDKTLKRKFQEAYLAIKLEKRFDKDEIMELYLNTIYLGHSCNGVASACKKYFSKNVEDINLPESALIASITKSPASYSPIKLVKSDTDQGAPLGEKMIDGINYKIFYNEPAFKRQKTVLLRLYELGYIDLENYDEALKYPIRDSIKPSL